MTDPQHPPSPAQELSLPVVAFVWNDIGKPGGIERRISLERPVHVRREDLQGLADWATAIASLQAAQQRAEAAEALVAGLRTALADSCADERHQKWEATPSGGGCSRAIDAEAERDAAYERAAKACENMATYCDDPDECAAAIRSLKTQEPA